MRIHPFTCVFGRSSNRAREREQIHHYYWMSAVARWLATSNATIDMTAAHFSRMWLNERKEGRDREREKRSRIKDVRTVSLEVGKSFSSFIASPIVDHVSSDRSMDHLNINAHRAAASFRAVMRANVAMWSTAYPKLPCYSLNFSPFRRKACSRCQSSMTR